jgi:hypothetical protein
MLLARVRFHAPISKDSANMIKVSNELPPPLGSPSEDGDEVNDVDHDGTCHHPRRYTRIPKS